MTEKAHGSLADSAYQRLKTDIIESTFEPDAKLLMTALKKRYDVGASPLREALSRLVSERLVVAESQRGFRVAPMSLTELVDIYDARAHIEGLIVTLALERGDDDWEAQVVAAHHFLRKIDRIDSVEDQQYQWDARHQEFHQAIANGCRSPQLLAVRQTLMDQVARYRYLWLRDTVLSQRALDEKKEQHQELTDRILARDSSVAERMREHLLTPVPIITRILHEQGLD